MSSRARASSSAGADGWFAGSAARAARAPLRGARRPGAEPIQAASTGWDPGATLQSAVGALLQVGQALVTGAIWVGIVVLPILAVPLRPVLPLAAAHRAGARAEDLCAELLRRAGLRILARNWRCRHGEIDLVADEGGTLVFAEVRLRRNNLYGGAAESVTPAKRERLLAAARLYLSRRRETNCRFDALLLDGAERPAIQWIRNAFGD